MKISDWELYRLLYMVDRAVINHGSRITRVQHGSSSKECLAVGREADLKKIRDWIRERKEATDKNAG
jgi:hypothetical protein